MKNRVLLAVGFLMGLCSTSAGAKPCERVIEMQSTTVLEQIALQPLRGVTLKFPFDLGSEAFYSISDASWLNYETTPKNLMSVFFQDIKSTAFGQNVDLTIGVGEMSFVLTFSIVEPTERYCPLITFTLSEALKQQLNDAEHQRQREREALAQQQAKIDSLAHEKSLHLMADLWGQKPKTTRLKTKTTVTEPEKKGRFIVKLTHLKTYADLSILTGRIINDTPETLRVENLRVSDQRTQSYAVNNAEISPGQSSPFRVVVDSVDLKSGELTLSLTDKEVLVTW